MATKTQLLNEAKAHIDKAYDKMPVPPPLTNMEIVDTNILLALYKIIQVLKDEYEVPPL